MDLAKFTDIADFLALQGLEVGCDPRVLEIDNAGEGLVEEGADACDWEVSGFGRLVDLLAVPGAA